MMRKIIFVMAIAASIYGCMPRYASHFLTKADVEYVNAAEEVAGRCDDVTAYIPNPDFPEHDIERLLRVNFHVMRRSDGTGNFTEEEGLEYAKAWIYYANKQIIKNEKMNLPEGNGTPILPTNYRYVLAADPSILGDKGVYYHDDDALYFFVKNGKYKNNYVKTAVTKYSVQQGQVLNVFMMPHHPDSIVSKTYEPTKTGIAFVREGAIKVAGNYFMYNHPIERNGKPFNRGAWFFHGILNHEIGHVLGLNHTWAGNDGCEDTPRHANCYSQNKKRQECVTGWSNNVMDYNTHQNAWSPCQIGRIQRNFAKKGSVQRALLVPTWCDLNPDKNIYIREPVVWRGAKDLEGNVRVERGGRLEVHCRLALPKGAKITVASGGELVLNGATLENDCGDTWKGIVVEGKGDAAGKVRFVNSPVLRDMQHEI